MTTISKQMYILLPDLCEHLQHAGLHRQLRPDPCRLRLLRVARHARFHRTYRVFKRPFSSKVKVLLNLRGVNHACPGSRIADFPGYLSARGARFRSVLASCASPGQGERRGVTSKATLPEGVCGLWSCDTPLAPCSRASCPMWRPLSRRACPPG
jgi:hypothetical protein